MMRFIDLIGNQQSAEARREDELSRSHDSAWQLAFDELHKLDKTMMKEYNDEVDTLLVFVSHFIP
jgi:uncharacterized protein YecA (UPF0149 family)